MMNRAEALLFVDRVRALAKHESVFCRELAAVLSPAEQSVLRSYLREAGAEFSMDVALMPQGRAR